MLESEPNREAGAGSSEGSEPLPPEPGLTQAPGRQPAVPWPLLFCSHLAGRVCLVHRLGPCKARLGDGSSASWLGLTRHLLQTQEMWHHQQPGHWPGEGQGSRSQEEPWLGSWFIAASNSSQGGARGHSSPPPLKG